MHLSSTARHCKSGHPHPGAQSTLPAAAPEPSDDFQAAAAALGSLSAVWAVSSHVVEEPEQNWNFRQLAQDSGILPEFVSVQAFAQPAAPAAARLAGGLQN